MRFVICTGTIFGLALTSSVASSNQLFEQGSILVSTNDMLYEYTVSGELLSQLSIPANAANEMVRDIAVLDDGRLAVYNGTFSPELAIYDGTDWSTFNVDGWSTVNNLSYGGITSIEDEVFVTDGFTYSGGEAQGLVSIDRNTGESIRFAVDSGYIDIAVGGDGLLYGLQSVYGDLDVFDPTTLTLMRTIDLGHASGSRSIAVHDNGDIYMASWDGYVAQYNPQGVVLNTLSIANDLTDIDMNDAGEIIVGNRFGGVYQTDDSLASYTGFTAGSNSVFVTFVPVSLSNPPSLSGSRSRKGRNITTTLSWTSDVQSTDVYFNGTLLETLENSTTAVYRYSKKRSQVFQVCNAGTNDCSEEYVAN